MIPVFGDPYVTAFLKALSLHRFCSDVLQRPASYTWPKIHLRWRHVSPFKANISANWNAVSSDMARMSHFCRHWRLKPSASKTISSVFHLHNTSATMQRTVSLTGWPAPPAWVPPNLSWGDSRPYAVLQRTLDKDSRQAEEPKITCWWS